MQSWLKSLLNKANQRLWDLGWRLGPRLSPAAQRRLVAVGASIALRRRGRHLRQLHHNLSTITGWHISPDLLRRAVESHLRNVIEAFALPAWSRAQLRERVSVIGEERLMAEHANGGVVIALPHSGSWDLAGAWACVSGLPVTSVAERLDGPAYARFLQFREQLGMEIFSHQDSGIVASLVNAVTRGQVVCLLSDRDLTGSGVPVRWAGHQISVPAGAALVARLSGATLLPGVCRYTGKAGSGGMVITLGEPIAPRPGRQGLIDMSQEVVDFFAAEISKAPYDWHMMQPFFPLESSLERGEDR